MVQLLRWLKRKTKPISADPKPLADAERIIAIGDIHGCAQALEGLLEAIEPTPKDLVVTLGDYVDRGLESRQVIDRLIRLQEECQLVPLLGNHEYMLLEALSQQVLFNFWMQCGGQQTLDSYGGSIEQIPTEHLDFMRGCRRYFETENHLFFHANFAPELAPEKQPDQLLLWEHLSEPQLEPHQSGKRVIVGHTPQPNGCILNQQHVTCLDTYCFGDGCLTAMEVQSQEIWQVNKQGVRCLWETPSDR